MATANSNGVCDTSRIIPRRASKRKSSAYSLDASCGFARAAFAERSCHDNHRRCSIADSASKRSKIRNATTANATNTPSPSCQDFIDYLPVSTGKVDLHPAVCVTGANDVVSAQFVVLARQKAVDFA